MEPFLKQAYEDGQQQAKEELAQKIREAVKTREARVGWKENSVAPKKLSKLLL